MIGKKFALPAAMAFSYGFAYACQKPFPLAMPKP
jgi:hypothetical protein